MRVAAVTSAKTALLVSQVSSESHLLISLVPCPSGFPDIIDVDIGMLLFRSM
jgi:hypothetical protein